MFASNDAGNTKFVLERINQTEKYLGSMCVQFGKVCRKEARLRDCNDALVASMFEFADRERINTSLRQSLQQYASYLSGVEDYRNTLITRIENQILEPLAKYGEVMKQKRNAVTKAIAARDKGVQRQRKLQQTSHRNPNNRDTIISMQVGAEYAQTEAARADVVVQEEIDKFEEMKLNDLKRYLTDFTLIQLAFHARAMEMYTTAHQQLLNIDVAHDLAEFRNAAPFHRLQPSQRSVSETALNNPKGVSQLIGPYSGSTSALNDHRRDADFGSRYSLPADTSDRKGQGHRSTSLRTASPTTDRTGRLAPAANVSSKGKTVKANTTESYSSASSSESDD